MYRWQKTDNRLRLVGVALSIFVLVTFAGGCSSAQQTANEGDTAFEKEDWDAAVYYYLQALNEDPDNVRGSFVLGLSQQLRGDHEGQ